MSRRARRPGPPRSRYPAWYGRPPAQGRTVPRDARRSTAPPLAAESGRAAPEARRSRCAIPTRTAAPSAREGPLAHASAVLALGGRPPWTPAHGGLRTPRNPRGGTTPLDPPLMGGCAPPVTP